MGTITKISWCNHSWNPWIGCTKVSPGCDNCYAETLNHRWGKDNWGKGRERRVTSDANWHEPIKWNKIAKAEGKQHLVFCASMADVMDDEAPEGARKRLWDLIDATPNLTWQLLTKRPHRYTRFLPAIFKNWNVWLGTSVENQEFYDVRWPILAEVRDRYAGLLTTFISYEPALGPVSMEPHAYHLGVGVPDWIIMGGESGAGRRPMQQEWAENLNHECEEHAVKFFMKQMSARTPEEGAGLIPAHLLIRQFPN